MWTSEVSERTDILGPLSAGIIRDSLTDVLLNPAYSADIQNNSLYLSSCADINESFGRFIALTDFGLAAILRLDPGTRYGDAGDESGELMKTLGLAYGYKLGKQNLGIGYSYMTYHFAVNDSAYEEEDHRYHYNKYDNKKESHMISLGMLRNNVIDISGKGTYYSSSDCQDWYPYAKMTTDYTKWETGINVRFFTKIPFFLSAYYFSTKYNLCDIYRESTSDSFRCYYSHNSAGANVVAKMGYTLIDNSNTKIYSLGQTNCKLYNNTETGNLFEPENGICHNEYFFITLGIEQQVAGFTVLGNITKGTYDSNTLYDLEDNPVTIGFYKEILPSLKIWAKLSPYITDHRTWNIETSYSFR